jgi:hypothetical protein
VGGGKCAARRGLSVHVTGLKRGDFPEMKLEKKTDEPVQSNFIQQFITGVALPVDAGFEAGTDWQRFIALLRSVRSCGRSIDRGRP